MLDFNFRLWLQLFSFSFIKHPPLSRLIKTASRNKMPSTDVKQVSQHRPIATPPPLKQRATQPPSPRSTSFVHPYVMPSIERPA